MKLFPSEGCQLMGDRESTQFHIAGLLTRREAWGRGGPLGCYCKALGVGLQDCCTRANLLALESEAGLQWSLVTCALVQLDVLYVGACGKWAQ